MLVNATRATLVVMGAEVRAATGIGCAEEFQRLANARAVVELPSDFAALDAGAAAEQLMDAVRAHVPVANQSPNAMTN